MELATEVGDQGVIDRRLKFVGRDEMAFGHIGCMLSTVDEHVIPRQMFRWTRPCNQLVPLVGTLKRRVDIKDHATIVEPLVMDDLPDEELGAMTHVIRVTEKRPRPGIGRPRWRRRLGQPDLVARVRVLQSCRAIPRFQGQTLRDDGT